MKKLLKLLSILGISTPIPLTVVACDNYIQKLDLNTIIINKDLGQIAFNKAPNISELLKAIKDKNSTATDLNEKDFVSKNVGWWNPSDKSAIIIGVGKYQGEVNLTYSKKENKTDLNTEITMLDITIKNITEFTNLNPNLLNTTISYFSDSRYKTDVSNQNQNVGDFYDFYVVVNADDNFYNYQD